MRQLPNERSYKSYLPSSNLRLRHNPSLRHRHKHNHRHRIVHDKSKFSKSINNPNTSPSQHIFSFNSSSSNNNNNNSNTCLYFKDNLEGSFKHSLQGRPTPQLAKRYLEHLSLLCTISNHPHSRSRSRRSSNTNKIHSKRKHHSRCKYLVSLRAWCNILMVSPLSLRIVNNLSTYKNRKVWVKGLYNNRMELFYRALLEARFSTSSNPVLQ
mmetsp:Transcript_21522/g.40187  ORF Transcript_21522/g.40187 Transcript_21522/m.40187 type:complete len:211 (+) Transcript_21522:691-1323(+)